MARRLRLFAKTNSIIYLVGFFIARPSVLRKIPPAVQSLMMALRATDPWSVLAQPPYGRLWPSANANVAYGAPQGTSGLKQPPRQAAAP